MMNYEVPEVGSWYRRLDRPQPFQVVAFDEDAATIDIEYFDGTVDEWPLTHWRSLPIESCAAPEDWTGPFDNLDDDGPVLSDAQVYRDEPELVSREQDPMEDAGMPTNDELGSL